MNGVVRGVAPTTILKPRGVAVIQMLYVKDLIDHCEFDTIYHEHLCYFSLTALDGLFRRHGLVIRDVERIPIHRGSLRIFAGRADAARPGAAVTSLLAEEAAWGVDREEGTLLNFFQIGDDTLDFVVDRSTVKQGRFTPGTHLPILAPQKLLERRPDYLPLLTWNFA